MASWLVELYDATAVVFVFFQLSVEYTKVTLRTPEFPAVTVAVTVTWSLGPGEEGVMLGVLMFGAGGAATRATAGRRSRNAMTNAKFLVNRDKCYSLDTTREAGTNPSCNRWMPIREILSVRKVLAMLSRPFF